MIQNYLQSIITLPLLAFCALPTMAATITVDPVNGSDINDGISAPVKTLKTAWSLMPAGGGHEMILKPGTYDDANDAVVTGDIVNGTPGNYNIIKAETDGTAIIKQPMVLSPTPSAPAVFPYTSDTFSPQYLQFEGLKWVNEIDNTPAAGGGAGDNVVINGHHIKILRSAFRGAGNCGNVSTLKIGQGSTESANWTPTHHILLEDSWVYGLGGRYNIQIFHADDIIIRRVVLRHDGGWNGASEVAGCKNDPEAAIATYNSADVHLQNVIVIDSDISYSAPGGTPNGNWEGTIYTLYNDQSGVHNLLNPAHDPNPRSLPSGSDIGVVHDNTGSTITGSVILFAHGNGFKYETGNAAQTANAVGGFPAKTVTGATLNDSAAVNVAAHGITLSTIGGGTEAFDVDVNNVLIATTETVAATRMNFGIRDNDSQGNNDLDINNTVIIGHEFSALNDAGGLVPFGEINVDCHSAGGNNCANPLGASPLGSDILFPPRLEAGAAITSGPTILKRMGTSGTVFGETGFNTLTETDLWPWPYESRIKRDFSEVPGVGIRRWTATNLTLTEYIWNALGANVAKNPASTGVLIGAPTGVTNN